VLAGDIASTKIGEWKLLACGRATPPAYNPVLGVGVRIMPAHVFLSYSQQDRAFADKLQSRIERSGLSVWRDIDPDRIRVGQEFWDVIEAAIKSVGCLITLVSRRSEKSDAVKREFDLAQKFKVPLLPLLIDAKDPTELDLWWRERIAHVHCESAVNGLAKPVERLIEEIRFHSSRRCPVIGLFNMKGGVGKTTLALQLAARLNVFYGRRVLLIDVDPQQNLTDFLLTRAQLETALRTNKSVIGLFEPTKIGAADGNDKFSCDPRPLQNGSSPDLPTKLHLNLIATPFDCIPSDMYAIKYTKLDRAGYGYEGNFAAALARLKKNYDYIVIDCNPSVSFLTGVALKVCNHILIPIKPDVFAFSGLQFTQVVLQEFFERSEDIRQGKLSLHAVFNDVTPVTQQPQDERHLIGEIRQRFQLGKCLESEIPTSKRMHVRREGALQTGINDLLAEAIIRRTKDGRAAEPLREMTDEYVRSIEGFHKLERRHSNFDQQDPSGAYAVD
jgi:chromosome partitioning protein